LILRGKGSLSPADELNMAISNARQLIHISLFQYLVLFYISLFQLLFGNKQNAFGRVVKGMEVVQEISSTKTNKKQCSDISTISVTDK
jgi:hypothetical protein